jgi:PilZ domain
MQFNSLANRLPSDLPSERRSGLRFDMHLPVLLRVLGDLWVVGETLDVSASGTLFVTDRPLLLSAPIEYVLTFPPDLTKAPQPLRVQFFGMVVRCERVLDSSGAFGVAVRNDRHRYVSRELSARLDAIEQKLLARSSSAPRSQPRNSST